MDSLKKKISSPKKKLKKITSVFLEPIRLNNPDKIDELVQAGFDINEQDDFFNYPIIYTVYHNHSKMHHKILSLKPNLDVVNNVGETALMISACRKVNPLLLKLVQANANINLRNLSGQTALILAVIHDNLVGVQELLKAGADLDIVDNNNQTAFMHALNKGTLDIVEAFVKKKPSLVETPINGDYPFIYCFLTQKKHLIKCLFPQNLDVNMPNKKYNGLSLFTYFSSTGSRTMVKAFIKNGAIVDFNKPDIQSIFVQMIDKNRHQIVSDLIKAGIAFSGKKGFLLGFNLLKSMLDSHFLFLENYLIFILKICAKQGYLDIIKELTLEIRRRADVYVIGELFYIAAKNNQSEIIKHLLEYYSHYILDQDFNDALNVAVQHQNITIVSIILKKCYGKISENEKKASLLQTIHTGNIDCLNVLLSKEDIEKLVSQFAHEIFIIIEQKMIHQPTFYQPMLDRLICFPGVALIATNFKNRIQDLFNLSSLGNLVSGPTNKDLFTRELEWIVKYTLRNSKKNTFSIEKDDIHVVIENQAINLSQLIEQSSLEHIFLNEEDSQFFFKIKILTQDEFDELQSPLPPEYILKGHFLTTAERFSIYDYSNFAHEKINGAIHKKPDDELNSSDKIFILFLQTVFLASGLNKLSPKWIREQGNDAPGVNTYRGERHITACELNQRILNLKHNPNGTIQRNLGFVSTSMHLEVANKFEAGLSRIEFDDCYGKDIQPIALLTQEAEYLQLPTHICFTDVKKQESLHVFKAKVVTPLYNKHRSLKQENRFKKLLHSTQSGSLLEHNPFDKLPYPQLADMLDICQYVYDNYLSKSFIDTWFKFDWDLHTLYGIINRPNHGLPHVMRVAKLVSELGPCLMDYDHTDFFIFSQKDINVIQLTALFSIVGRKSEASFLEPIINGSGYKAYKKASATAFIAYMQENNLLNLSFEEIIFYANNIRKMGSLKLNTPSGILLNLAHKLDLLRCTVTDAKIKEKIIYPLSRYLPDTIVEKLLIYSEQLLHATGDRVFHGINTTDEYNCDIFYRASTNVNFCFNAINQVEIPDLTRKNICSLINR